MRPLRIGVLGLALSLSQVWPAWAADDDCGTLVNSYGPYDYRTATPTERMLVDGAHFTPEVERLIRGKTGTTPGADIAYTLRAYPNHWRALSSMMNLAFRNRVEKPSGSTYSIRCWFDRAERFTPDDGTVQLLYGIYVLRKGDPKDAIDKFSRAEELSGESANLHYNFGLAYVDLHDYDKAMEHARAAYRLGFPLPGLRNKLQAVGKWRADDTPAATAPETDKSEKSGSQERRVPDSGRAIE